MERKKLRAREYRKEQRSKADTIAKENDGLKLEIKNLQGLVGIEKEKVSSLSLELAR